MDKAISDWIMWVFGDEVWRFILTSVLVAFALYVLRLYARAVYGFLEIIGGIFILYLSYKVQAGDYGKDFAADFSMFKGTVTVSTMLGGMFALVRGFDNVENGIMKRRRRNAFVVPNDH